MNNKHLLNSVNKIFSDFAATHFWIFALKKRKCRLCIKSASRIGIHNTKNGSGLYPLWRLQIYTIYSHVCYLEIHEVAPYPPTLIMSTRHNNTCRHSAALRSDPHTPRGRPFKKSFNTHCLKFTIDENEKVYFTLWKKSHFPTAETCKQTAESDKQTVENKPRRWKQTVAYYKQTAECRRQNETIFDEF